MAAPVYATVDDWITYTGAPGEIEPRYLAIASAQIDRALRGAVYDVDDDDLPTDDDIAAAIRDATCAQTRPLLTPAGNPTGGLTVEARDILMGAGLLPARAWVTG